MDIRAQLKKARLELTPEVRQKKNSALERNARTLADELMQWPVSRWGVFSPFGGEPDLTPLWHECARRGVQLFYPRVIEQTPGHLPEQQKFLFEFVALTVSQMDDPRCWQTGRYGVRAPHTDLPALSDLASLSAIWVPGLAFGRQGERMGMGKGYYDQTLFAVTHVPRIGVAYEFQVLDSLPQNHWDLPMHWLVTDEQCSRFSA